MYSELSRMKKYVTEKVESCWHCPLLRSAKTMECGHPFFEGKGYDCMIINQNNCHGTVYLLDIQH